MKVLVLGNTAPKEVHRTDDGLDHRPLEGRTETTFVFPDEREPRDALAEVLDAYAGFDPDADDPYSDPERGYHSNAAPAWVAGDQRLAAVVGAHYDCPVGVPGNWRSLDHLGPEITEALDAN